MAADQAHRFLFWLVASPLHFLPIFLGVVFVGALAWCLLEEFLDWL